MERIIDRRRGAVRRLIAVVDLGELLPRLLGFARSNGFASPERAAFDEPRVYTRPPELHLNQWALAGDWTLSSEAAVNNAVHDRIAYRFHARDLHLILVPPAGAATARFRVLLDDGHSLTSAGTILELQDQLAAAQAAVDELRQALRAHPRGV